MIPERARSFTTCPGRSGAWCHTPFALHRVRQFIALRAGSVEESVQRGPSKKSSVWRSVFPSSRWCLKFLTCGVWCPLDMHRAYSAQKLLDTASSQRHHHHHHRRLKGIACSMRASWAWFKFHAHKMVLLKMRYFAPQNEPLCWVNTTALNSMITLGVRIFIAARGVVLTLGVFFFRNDSAQGIIRLTRNLSYNETPDCFR